MYVTVDLRLMLCSSPTIQISITFRILVGSKLNNLYLLIARLFAGCSSIHVVAVHFGKITAFPVSLILVKLGFQLRHASLGAVPRSLCVKLGVDLQPDILS